MPKQSIFIFGGAIGDALLGVQLLHALQAADAHNTLTLLSTRRSNFVRQLLETVPHARYRELPRNDLRSWTALVGLALRPHAVVFLEPFQDTIPLWWRIIARVVTLMPGSLEVRCQSRPQKAPTRVRTLAYNPKTDNLFAMIARVPALWGARAVEAPAPSLAISGCASAPQTPYILFHFFAGAYRRSFPIEKVRPLLAAAREQFLAHEFVLTCAHQEEAAARAMIEGVANTRVEVSPDARDLLCLLKNSSVCIGVASGVTHIASHLGVPSVIMCNLSDPCWLPTYAKNSTLLSAREHCGCNGDKTGECNIDTPGGGMYRCLYDLKTETIIEAMKGKLS